MQVTYGTHCERLPLIVVTGDHPSLLGRNWLRKICLDWKNISHLSYRFPSSPEALLKKFSSIFQSGLGTFTGNKVNLSLCTGATPRFHKPRAVPFAIRDAVGQELDRLESEGIIEKVSSCDWASPIVAVPKPDGTYRICGDYKVTCNPVLEIDQYPLPNPSDLIASLAGGKTFTKLDLTQAYQQLLLDDPSKQYTTINAHQGLYQYNRLLYGIATTPAVL